MDKEFTVCTFWRSNSRQETMHVYGPFTPTRAQVVRTEILKDYRKYNTTGPLPVVRVVKMQSEVPGYGTI